MPENNLGPMANMQFIGVVHSPYKEKFGTPRQPGLAKNIATIEIYSEFSHPELTRGLEGLSHLWIIFYFHLETEKGWKPLIRPPRLGGQKKMGLLATRSPHRPNHIGMSAVKIEKFEFKRGQNFIEVSGVDLVDGTPVFDIKPYIPEYDSIAAKSGWIAELDQSIENEQLGDLSVVWNDIANEKKKHLNPIQVEEIEGYLALDPRPANQKKQHQGETYANYFDEWNIVWSIEGRQVTVLELLPLPQTLN